MEEGIYSEQMGNNTHHELSGLCSVKGSIEIVKGGIRTTEGEENMGLFRVSNKCSLNDCGVECRKSYSEANKWLGLEVRGAEGGFFLEYSSA